MASAWDLTERRVERGFFWLPDDPDVVIAGELTFDDDTGLSLDLFGTFVKDMGTLIAGVAIRYPVIFGIAGGPVTLLGSAQTRFQINAPGAATEGMRVLVGLFGAHVNEEDPLFSEVAFTSGHMSDWLDPLVPMLALGGGPGFSWRAEYVQPPALDIYRDDGSLVRVSTLGSIRGGRHLEAEVGSVVRAYPRTAMTLSELLGIYVLPLRDLITFGTASPAPLQRLSVAREDVVIDVQGTWFPRAIEVVLDVTQPRHDVRRDEDIMPPFQMFGPGDVPGGIAAAVSRWLDTYLKSKEAIDLLIGETYQPSYSYPARVANLIKALEAYDRLNEGDAPEAGVQERIHRILAALTEADAAWLTQRLTPEPSLRARLRRLVRRARPVIEPVAGKERTMLDAFTGLRNADAHPGDRKRVPERSALRMRRAVLWARWTLVANLLLDLGLTSERAAAALIDHQVFVRAVMEMNRLSAALTTPARS